MSDPQAALFGPEEVRPRIPAITLWEPWASAIAVGLKSIETRSWVTGYRGPISIHAAKKLTDDGRILWWEHKAELPAVQASLGCVLAVANLVRCTRMTPANIAEVPDQERVWGYFEPGRFMWVLENVRRLREPIPAKGAQGVWRWAHPANLEELFA